MDSTYQDAADLLEGTEAAQHGLDNHSSNGIYVEVSAAEDVHPIDGSSVEMSRMSGSLWDAVSSPERGLDMEEQPLLSAGSTQLASNNHRNVRFEIPSHRNNLHNPSIARTTTASSQVTTDAAGMADAVASTGVGNVGDVGDVGGDDGVRRYYAPTVIPIVQSKESMVIVGAVLRKDVKESLAKIKALSDVALAPPVRQYTCARTYMSCIVNFLLI